MVTPTGAQEFRKFKQIDRLTDQSTGQEIGRNPSRLANLFSLLFARLPA